MREISAMTWLAFFSSWKPCAGRVGRSRARAMRSLVEESWNMGRLLLESENPL
jgi:hypothetical protein